MAQGSPPKPCFRKVYTTIPVTWDGILPAFRPTGYATLPQNSRVWPVSVVSGFASDNIRYHYVPKSSIFPWHIRFTDLLCPLPHLEADIHTASMLTSFENNIGSDTQFFGTDVGAIFLNTKDVESRTVGLTNIGFLFLLADLIPYKAF